MARIVTRLNLRRVAVYEVALKATFSPKLSVNTCEPFRFVRLCLQGEIKLRPGKKWSPADSIVQAKVLSFSLEKRRRRMKKKKKLEKQNASHFIGLKLTSLISFVEIDSE